MPLLLLIPSMESKESCDVELAVISVDVLVKRIKMDISATRGDT